MNRRAVYFTAPRQVALRDEPVPLPGPGQVLVETLASAISPGTEMLVYRGQAPAGLALDETIGALAGTFRFPLKYGYAAVGRVTEGGRSVDPGWSNRLVFAFNPHESCFLADLADLHPIPPDLDPDDALFLPTMETAVNFVLDGRPAIGEHVVVFGQGIVGLLTTALLARHPLAGLVTLDRYPGRRARSIELGARASLDPLAEDISAQLTAHLPADLADLAYEISGAPEVLNQAIAATGFAGRVVIGSWYGEKRAPLDLGGRFHRGRIRLIGSQVSTLTPDLLSRWTKGRRLDVAWQMIRAIRPARFITHRFRLDQAAEAYDLLDRQPAEALQVVLTY